MPRREFNLTDLNGVNGFAINGIAAGDQSGYSVASAGDVNGDDVGDIVIGAPFASSEGRNWTGQGYVVFGHNASWPVTVSLSSLIGSNGFILQGVDAYDLTGFSVSSAGDLNADGVSDIIIGAIGAFGVPLQVFNSGHSYLVFGRNTSWPAALELSALNGVTGVSINGSVIGDHLGWSVASAGDVNNDGVADIIIGAFRADPDGRDRAGESYIVFGHTGSWSGNFEVSSLNGTLGIAILGAATADRSGIFVGSAGDINNDGFDDVIIGADLANPNGRVDAGQMYLVFGHDGVWNSDFEISSLNAQTGIVINGIAAGDNMGYVAASLVTGDFNDDGIDDVIIGAIYASPGNRTQAGQSYIIFGRNETWPGVLELSSLNGRNGLVINGISAGDRTGHAIGSVRDINGDEISDIIVAASLADPDGRADAGQCYVVFGRRGQWPAVIELSSLNENLGVIINGISSGDLSGASVAPAGDVNGDGFDDIIIGAPYADPGGRVDAGQSYVIFGGAEQFSANQIEIQSGQMIRLTQENLAVDPIIGNRTFTVTNTSHINFVSTYNTSAPLSNFTQQQINDGEILVIHDGSREAPSYTVSAEGITRIFSDVHPQQGNVSFSIGTPRISAPHREFNLSDLNGVNGFTINGITAGDLSGISIASAGDVNGDGIDDIVIGAVLAAPNDRLNAGQSYLVFGRNTSWPGTIELSTLNVTSGVIMNGIAANDYSGVSVGSAGDVNGDGLKDVIIGAYAADPNGRVDAGQCYLLFGHHGAWMEALELAALNSTLGVTINGAAPGDVTGYFVASAGDVNGDGFDDVIISSHYGSPAGRGNAGQSYLVFGHNGSWPTNLELSSLDARMGVVINGIFAYDLSSYPVAEAGDVNGDGFDDFVIGAHYAGPNGHVHAGQSYLIFGRAGVWPAALELSALNGITGVIINGVATDDYSGIPITAAGDVNGDGFDDVVIGASGADPDGRAAAGESYLVFGHMGSWSASLELSSLDGMTGVTINGISNNDVSGRFVAPAGDVNADGFDDVIISSFVADPGGRVDSGQSYLIFGHNGSWPAVFELSSLVEVSGLMINGIASGDRSGNSVASAGDVNGDGFDDVIIGAPYADPDNRTDAGASYVIFGGAEQFSANQIIVNQGETLALSTNNIEIEPNIDSRIINVTDVSHGHFAFVSNASTNINTFTQAQINNNEIVFVHDGSDQAPSYTVSAEGITRVFSNVHPQAANVSFVLSTSTTSTHTSITSTTLSTVTDTTRTETSTTDTATSIAPTVAPTVNPTSFFAVPTSAPTAQINEGGETVTNDNGGSSDSSGLIIGILSGVVGIMALIIAFGYIYYRRNEHEKQKAILAREAEGARGPQTTAMTENPLFVAGANRTNVSDENTGYLTVAGDGTDYEVPVPVKTAGIVLDADHYVVDPVQSTSSDAAPAFYVAGADGAIYAVPMAASAHRAADNSYSLFSSKGLAASGAGLSDFGEVDDVVTSDTQYRVFRSPGSSQG